MLGPSSTTFCLASASIFGLGMRSVLSLFFFPYHTTYRILSHFHDGCDSFDQKFDADLSITLTVDYPIPKIIAIHLMAVLTDTLTHSEKATLTGVFVESK